MSDRYSIQAFNEPQSQWPTTLLSILEAVLPVKFWVSDQEQASISGQMLTANRDEATLLDGTTITSLTVPRGKDFAPETKLSDFTVQFSADPNVPFPFRGRSLKTQLALVPAILSPRPDERVLASCERGPVWVFSERNATKHFRSGFVLPALPPEGGLQDVLSGRRFLEMLPLLHWLREICGHTPPVFCPLRASFIFDDPNLHWPHYGYVNYRHLAAQAERENYHVAFATIPLDTWFTHAGTADIFRQHQNRLSLLVHGNNHAKRELARSYTNAERIYLLKEAIRRIERLERRSGLTVSRVMVPPHGACSEEMLATLPACSFEAACISHGSLRAHNKSGPWTRTLGYLPFEHIRGCPVLPRWGVSGDLRNTILLAAYLNQAIILRGHHQDLKNGPELLDELARFVNGLGSVAWSNMTEIVRSKSLAGQMIAMNGLTSPIRGDNGPEVKPRGSLDVAANPVGDRSRHAISSGSILFIRRLLTEGRDRFLLNSR
jgi:hypothetical protein